MKEFSLPPSQASRLALVRRAVEVERRPPGEFNGKRLQSARHIFSIPIGRRWRALFADTAFGYKFRDCLTHERYNKANFAANEK